MPQVSAPRQDEMLARYRATYALGDDVELTVEQASEHLRLERKLTAELLDSSPAGRWDTFERCYNELYTALPWLIDAGGIPDAASWGALIGPAPKRVYEVGSGTGALARALAASGYLVEATDIARGGTRETTERLSWSVTDGVHLDQFARAAPYDAVISDQMVEHLHPDDILVHCRSARSILHPGGCYVLRTPQALTGPHDLSLIFGFERPVGMHLHEYTNRELHTILIRAGYRAVRAVIRVPDRGGLLRGQTASSAVYLRYLIATEHVLGRLDRRRARRLALHLRGPLHPHVWIVARR